MSTHQRDRFTALWEIFAPLGGTVFSLIVVPLLIEQYPEWFKDNRWTVPLSIGIVLVCWIVPFLFHSRVRRLYLFILSMPASERMLALLFIAIILGATLSGMWQLFVFHSSHLARALAKKEQVAALRPSILPSDELLPIQISVRCTGDSLPIKVIPGKPLYSVMIYEDYNRRQKMALTNDLSTQLGLSRPTFWPDADTINAADANELFTVRCDFTNHGDSEQDNAVSVKIPVTIEYFHNVLPDRGLDPKTMNATSTTNYLFVGTLDHGQTVSFHFINNCFVGVAVNTPDTATGRLVGESNARNFRLERPNDYSREGFQLGPTRTNWGHMVPCIE